VITRRSVALLRLVLPLAALTVLAEIAYPLAHGTGRDLLTVLVVLLFAATSVAHAAVSRGARAAAGLLVVCGGGGLLVEALGTATGIPFGRYDYTTGSLGPTVLGVPLLVPLAWVMMGWPAYLVGLLLADRAGWSGPIAKALVAGWALASWDLFLDPQLVDAGAWRWVSPRPALPGVPMVPLSNYAGWLLAATALLVGLDAAVGAAARPQPTDLLPYGLYLWTYVSSLLGQAAFLGLPGSALWGGLGMGAVALPLALSLRSPAPAAAAAAGGEPQ
jgi:putative membrane protein